MKQKIVVKVGSLAVTHAEGGVHQELMARLCLELKALKDLGYAPILVSSGAINTARAIVDIQGSSISVQQALASIGQPVLMHSYINILQKSNIVCAQILLTHEDFADEHRRRNVLSTINVLLEKDILPIINENDTVSYAEITLGDNDHLSALVAQLTEAKKLLILTQADGLYDKNPKDPTSKVIAHIHASSDISHVVMAEKTGVGRGGMESKLTAIFQVVESGCTVYLGSYEKQNCLTRLLEHKGGSCFHAR
jgi:glutamate 5-kinase